MKLEIKMYSLTERERGEESAWEYVRSIMRYSSPLIHSLAVIDYVHRLFVYMCAACVCDYINLSLFSPYAYLFWYFVYMSVRVHKNNPFTGWFNFLLGVCMRVCIHMCVCVCGSGNSFGNNSRNCCLTLCGNIPSKRIDIFIDRDRSLIYRYTVTAYYMFPVLSRLSLALFMSCLFLVHRFCIYLLRLSFRFYCFGSFVVLESALPHILHTLLPSHTQLSCLLLCNNRS